MRTRRSKIHDDVNQLMLAFDALTNALAATPAEEAKPAPAPEVEVEPAAAQAEFAVPAGKPDLTLKPIPTTFAVNEEFEEALAEGLTRTKLAEPDSNGSTMLHYLVGTDRLQAVPAQWLTAEVLGRPDAAGNTPAHLAAAKGTLELLPQDELTPSVIETKNDAGQNLVQVAVAAGTLAKVPADLLDSELLAQPDQAGHSALAYALASDQAGCLPEAMLPGNDDAEAFEAAGTKAVEDFNSSEVVLEAEQHFEEVMRDVLEQAGQSPEPEAEVEDDVEAELNDDEEEQVREPAVKTEEELLEQLYEQYASAQPEVAPLALKPVEELTAEDLLVQDKSGETRLFYVIINNEVDRLSPGVITEEACRLQDCMGNTPAHLLARYSEAVPEAFASALTPEVLLIREAQYGRAAVHEFAQAGLINQLPEASLTFRVLQTPDADGFTALQYAQASGIPCEVEPNGFGEPPLIRASAYPLQPGAFVTPTFSRSLTD